jgi:predicted Zn-dependent protease with MMP-like domain
MSDSRHLGNMPPALYPNSFGVCYNRPMKVEVYERLIDEAVADLPEELRSRIQNLEIVIEDRPTRAQLRAAGVYPPSTLLGLYQGIPLTGRGSWYGNVLPDKITIFRKPIEAQSADWDDFVRVVRETVLHEIGHHFGLSDARLHEIERDWRRRDSRPSMGGGLPADDEEL